MNSKQRSIEIEIHTYLLCKIVACRAVGRSENPGVPILFGGHNLPHLVEIGLTDLPKSRGAMAPLAPPGTTPLSTHAIL